LSVGSFCYEPVEEICYVSEAKVEEGYPCWDSWDKCVARPCEPDEESYWCDDYGEDYDVNQPCDESFAPVCECELGDDLCWVSAGGAVNCSFGQGVSAFFAVGQVLVTSVGITEKDEYLFFVCLWIGRMVFV